MTKTYFPFDSGAGAVSYEASWRKMARLWRTSGPINGALNGLLPYGDSTGMQVKVPTGQAWIDGFYFETDITYTLAIAAADPSNPRIDVVVLRLDMSANTVDFGILTGTAAVSPTAPSVTQGTTIWEIALAQVRVDALVVTIAAGKVTDVRQMSYSINDVNMFFQACSGRLTLTSGAAVTTSDVMAAATLYFTPYLGNRVFLYGGASQWRGYLLNEISLSLSGYTASKNYDIFLAYSSGLVLESVAWTSDSARATALTLQDGIYVKSGDATRRYLGTIRTTAVAGQCEDSLVNRLVFNYYNRKRRKLYVKETVATWWTYNAAVWRPFNNNIANRVNFVVGVSDAPVEATFNAQILNVITAVAGGIGIGFDATNTNSAQIHSESNSSIGTAFQTFVTAQYSDYVAEGFHYLQELEYARLGTVNFAQNQGQVTLDSGMFAYLEA